MNFKTRQQLLNGILGELALVSGTSVQVYTQPTVYRYIQQCFDHLFEKRFWDHLTSTTYHTLDGTAGVITDEISGINKITDVKWIRESPYENSDKINIMRDGIYVEDGQLWYTGMHWQDAQYENKFIQFYPKTSEANIAIRARRYPDEFVDDDKIPFDSVALIHFVTASLLASDGMNPGAQQRQSALFEDRYETLLSNESNEEIVTKSGRFASEFTVA